MKSFDNNINVQSGWTQLGNTISGLTNSERFGHSVCFSADGTTLAIGAPDNDGAGTDRGAVRIYDFDGTDWSQRGLTIEGPTNTTRQVRFGESLHLTPDGNTVAILCYEPGVIGTSGYQNWAMVYVWDGQSWTKKGSDLVNASSRSTIATSIKISDNGNIVIFGCPEQNLTVIYDWDGTNWNKRSLNVAGEADGDLSGFDLDINANGDILAIGAPDNDAGGSNSGHVRVWSWNGATWTRRGGDIDGIFRGDNFGRRLSLSSDGNILAITGANGGARVFRWDAANGDWRKMGSTIVNNFAPDIAISVDGNIVVTAENLSTGGVRGVRRFADVIIYQWDANNEDWIQIGGPITAEIAGDDAGTALDVNTNADILIAIGCPGFLTGNVKVYKYNTPPAPTPTPTPTPTPLEHQSYALSIPFSNSTFSLPLPESQQYDSTKLIDTDTLSPGNMTVVGCRVSLFSPTNIVTLPGQDGSEFLLDKKPDPNNPEYINGHPNLSIGTAHRVHNPSIISKYLPASIIPQGSAILNSNRESFGRYLKANIAYKQQPTTNRGSNIYYCPRLKSGIAILNTRTGYPTFNITNPSARSVIMDNYIFGDYNTNSDSVVSCAYHRNSNMLFLAVVDDIGNGRIVLMDANTFHLTPLHEIQFPAIYDSVTNTYTSDIDILFEVYIRSQDFYEDQLFVNMAGTSGKKVLRIYKLNDLYQPYIPPPSPTPTTTPTITPTISVTPTVTPSITATIPLTPTITPTLTNTPTVTPTSAFNQYRYTRKTLILENLVPCNNYQLTLDIDSSQVGNTEIQILDSADIRKTQFDNTIIFKAQNVQKYFRSNVGAGLPKAYDDKSYQSITYTLYHSIFINKAVLKFTLTNLDTGKVITETRIIECDNYIDCSQPREDCVDQNIQQIVQHPDGSFSIYVQLDPEPIGRNMQDILRYINDNKCCSVEYQIDDGEWGVVSEDNIVNCRST